MDSCQVSVYNLSSQLLRHDSEQDTQELHHPWVFSPQTKETGVDSEQLGFYLLKKDFALPTCSAVCLHNHRWC